MEIQTAIEILTYHQEWRLGKREDMIHEPKKLTEALDILLKEVKKLHKPDIAQAESKASAEEATVGNGSAGERCNCKYPKYNGYTCSICDLPYY